jgi:dihydroorotase
VSDKVKEVTIIRPDDWHIHFRDEDAGVLGSVVPSTANVFGRALIMPNLVPPVTSAKQAIEYRRRILTKFEGNFQPYMTIYLTDHTTIEDIRKAVENPFILAAKLYPAGATTNSDAGVTDIKKIDKVLAEMERLDFPLCVHGEVTHGWIFRREEKFIDEVLIPFRQKYPGLRVIFEHISSKAGADYVLEAEGRIMATITPHHLLHNGNDMLVGGIKPHIYCLPVLKEESDQEALIRVATSGNFRFSLGTDSAPHKKGAKESACGCAGCFSAPTAIQMYTQVFDEANALVNLEAFASTNGADFYNLPHNTDTITLVNVPMTIPNEHIISKEDGDVIVPLMFGEELKWSIK